MIQAPEQTVNGPSLTYDAIELDQAAAADLPLASAAIQPTIFYVRQGSGLKELVDVYVRNSAQAWTSDFLQMTVGDGRFRTPLPAANFSPYWTFSGPLA